MNMTSRSWRLPIAGPLIGTATTAGPLAGGPAAASSPVACG
jgi:hypothetical protein